MMSLLWYIQQQLLSSALDLHDRRERKKSVYPTNKNDLICFGFVQCIRKSVFPNIAGMSSNPETEREREIAKIENVRTSCGLDTERERSIKNKEIFFWRYYWPKFAPAKISRYTAVLF